MAKHIPGAFRRVLALATSVLLIAAQLVLPVAALAQDISMLPTVTLQWIAPADGSVQSTTVMASLYGEQVVYWATVPEEALQNGVTIAGITGMEDPSMVTYAPAVGTPVTGNSTAVDGIPAVNIEVWRNGAFEIAYPLYLSVIPMPPYQPAGPTSGTVHISYSFAGAEVYGFDETVPAEGRSFAPDASLVPAGYELVSTGEVLVKLNPDGTTSPNPVVFEVQQSAPQVVNSTVTFHHLDEVTGQQITGDTWEDLAPETYSASTYQQAVEGYTYSYASPDPFTVDGMGTPVEVTLYYTPSAPQVVNSTVTAHHVDAQTGQPITGDTTAEAEANMETYSSIYQTQVEGYTYSYADPESFTPDGMGTPVEVTLYYTQNAPEPVNSTVTVHHVDAQTSQPITGDTTAEADANMETYSSIYQTQVEGYTYSYADPESFTPDGMGTPVEVALYYTQNAPEQVNSTVTIHHRDAADTGVSLADDTTQSLPAGPYDSAAYAIGIDGYTFQSADPVSFNVDGAGTPVEVTLYYAQNAPEPVNSTVTFHHKDAATDQELTSTQQELAPNTYASADYKTEIEGYTYASAAQESFTVDGTGAPVDVTLYYNQNAPTEPVVLEEYTNQYGITTKGSLNLRSSPTTKDNNKVVQGVNKDVVMPTTQRVQSLDNDGYSWYRVNYNGTDCYVRDDCFRLLTEEEMQQYLNVEVPVKYVDQATDEAFYTTTAQCMKGGSVTVEADLNQAQGYTLVSEASVQVSADANGTLTPAEVVFTFAKEQQAVKGTVSAIYVDEAQKPVAEPQTFERDPGNYSVNEFAINTPEGYEPLQVNVQEVIVHDDGTVEPETVVFTYAVKQTEPVNSVVTFHHLCDGAAITGDTQQELAPNTYNASDYQAAVEGYTYAGASPETFTVDGTGAAIEVTLNYTKVVQQLDSVVTFHHLCDGAAITGDTQQTLAPNTYNAADYQTAVEGYTYAGASPETFTVDGTGVAIEVTLNYTKVVQQLDSVVTFHHLCDGAAITGDTQQTLAPNTYGSASYQATVEGYTYAGANPETFTVDGSGAPIEVTLNYTKNAPQVVNSIVTFHHADANGTPIAADTQQELAPNTYSASGYQVAVPGYTYTSANPESFTVDGKGTPVEVTLTYTKDLVASKVTFHHVDADGNPLMADRTVEVAPSAEAYRSESYASAAPEGYLYASANPETFTVDGSGTPITVVFTYAKKPAVTAPVTFEYVSESGRVVDNPMTVDLPVGPNDVMEYCKVVEGYTFKSASSQTVEVSADGVATPAKVTFTYTENPTTATVQVHYRNSIGDDLPGSPVIKQLGPGTYTIQPENVPAGYIVSSSAQPQPVTVTNDLVATPNSISFTCYDANITGTLTINYYDAADLSKPIATEQRPLKPGLQTVAADDSVVAKAGNYQRTEGYADQQVQVNEDGTVVPATISFYYKSVQNTSYVGYAVTTRQTAMRASAAANGAVTQTLTVNTLLYINGQQQVSGVTWDSSQTVLGGTSASGWVTDADVRHISASEAQALIDQYNQQQQKPTQSPGYYITLYNSVPLRTYTNIYAEARYLKKDTVVYVHSQEYDGSRNIWHLTTYDGVTGYVLNGQLRKLTEKEVENYLASGNPSTPENPGGNPYNPNGASSYGYITANSVNFRTSPNGSRIKQLNKYAMAMILGTQQVNGVTWYNVNYNGQIGWIHGDYFHQMTLTEFNSFLSSSQYQQGLANNAVATATPKPSTGGSTSGNTSGNKGSATQGSVSSVEDWNVGTWQNTGANTQNTYAPFNPYATPVATTTPKDQYMTKDATVKFYQSPDAASSSLTLPANATLNVLETVTQNNKTWYKVQYNGQTGYVEAEAALTEVTASASPTPTSTFVIGTMIPINYEDETIETQTSGVPWGLIGGAVVIIGGAGGAYAYALNQNKKRKAAAARAAASRRAATAAGTTAAGAAGAASPYARRAAAAPIAPGTKQNDTNSQNKPTGGAPYGGVKNPYSSGSITGTQNPYSRPTAGSGTSATTAGSQGLHGGAPTGTAQNPYARSAQAGTGTGAAAVTGTAQNPYARSAQAGTGTGAAAMTGTAQNPYAATGTQSASASAKPASAQTTGTGSGAAKPYAAGAASRIPYADGTMPTAGGFTGSTDASSASGASTASAGGSAMNPASGSPMSSGLHSAGSLESRSTSSASGEGAAQTANPYARPLGAAPASQSSTQESQGAESATRRRSTRMQRYHAAGGDDEGSDT